MHGPFRASHSSFWRWEKGTFPEGTISLLMPFSFTGLRKGLLQICASDMELPCVLGRPTSCLSPSLLDPPAPFLSFPFWALLPSPPFSLLLSPSQGRKIFPNTVSKMLSAHKTNQKTSPPLPSSLRSCYPICKGCCWCELRKSRDHSSSTGTGQSSLGNTGFPRLYLSRSHCRLQFSTGVALSPSPSTSLPGRSLLNLPWEMLVVLMPL